ncbi:unnamed protein product [Caenorhabditis angaria]|uniref:LITAF domain-containing protein n=1 Tax=Caenorhabditis angaria TaxID=860376 RepID=A0A9P1IJA9_9PELO|nr:unnamed protein product [Caenorhabditis angaria]
MSYPKNYPIQVITATPIKVVKHIPKETTVTTPYLEFCPRCQATIMTSCFHHTGTCWWIICFTGVFLFCWPILFFLCCDSSKDVDHNCPNCGLLLAESKKAGC